MDHFQLFFWGVTAVSAVCFALMIYLVNLHASKFIALGLTAAACACLWPSTLRGLVGAYPYASFAMIALAGVVLFVFVDMLWLRGIQRLVGVNAEFAPVDDAIIEMVTAHAEQFGFKEEFLHELDNQKSIHGESGLEFRHLELAVEIGRRSRSLRSE